MPTLRFWGLIFESGRGVMMPANERLEALIAPAVAAAGCALWGIEHSGRPPHSVLRVFIDREAGVTIDDCERVSHQVSAVLDVEDPIAGEYTLEVSSPGLDRILFRREQCVEAIGEDVDVRVQIAVDGRRRFTGKLVAVEGDALMVVCADGEAPVAIEIAAIRQARIVPSFKKDRTSRHG